MLKRLSAHNSTQTGLAANLRSEVTQIPETLNYQTLEKQNGRQVWLFYRASKNERCMDIPVYLWLKDNGDIKCPMDVQSHEGSTEIMTQDHWLRDNNTVKLAGTRTHTPIIVVKEVNVSTPHLYKAVTTCQTRRNLNGIALIILTKDGVVQHQIGRCQSGKIKVVSKTYNVQGPVKEREPQLLGRV